MLAVTLVFASRRWRAFPQAVDPGPLARAVVILATTGGLLGAPFWWLDLPASFAWDLPLLASRMLAAAALAFGIAGVCVLERPSIARFRLMLLLLCVYLLPLAIAILSLHLDRLNAGMPITYGFFAAVSLVGGGAALALFGSRWPQGGSLVAPPAVWRGCLRVAGVLLLLWGTALFIAPATPLALMFPWPGDPLTSRLIASMILSLGVAMLAAARDATLLPVVLVFAAVYGCGVFAACVVNALGGRPVPLLYAAALGLLGVASLAGLLWRRTSLKTK